MPLPAQVWHTEDYEGRVVGVERDWCHLSRCLWGAHRRGRMVRRIRYWHSVWEWLMVHYSQCVSVARVESLTCLAMGPVQAPG